MVLIAAIFYIKYDVLRLRKLAKDLGRMSIHGKGMPEDQRDRMAYLLNLAKESGNRTLGIAWEDYYREYSVVMLGKLVPDVKEYINEERLINIPCARGLIKQLWQALLMLGVAGNLIYLALALGGGLGSGSGETILRSVGISLFSLAVVTLILLGFKLADAMCLDKARRSLWEVQYLVNSWLNPVTQASMIGVLVESQRQHSQVFREAVGQLEQRLDHFETGTLAPVLGRMFQEAVEHKLAPVLREASGMLTLLAKTVVLKQENGMRDLANTFTEKLTAVTADRLNGFVETAEGASRSLTDVVSKMEQIQAAMVLSKEAQETFSLDTRTSLAEVGRIQIEVSEALKASMASVQAAEKIAGEMREISVRGLDKADAMALQSLHLQEGNLKQLKGLQQGIGEMTQTVQIMLESSIAQVSGELTKAVSAYTGLSVETEASHMKHSEKLDLRIIKLVGELEIRFTEHTHAMAQQTVHVVEGNLAQVEGLQSGLREMADTLQQKLESTMGQISGELTSAVIHYTEMSERIEASREKYSGDMDTRIDQLVGKLDHRLMDYSDRVMLSGRETDERFQGTLKTILNSQALTMERLAATSTEVSLEGGKILEKTSLQANELYSGLAGRLDQSINALGENLATAMKATMGDSAEIVERLALKTEGMKELYDSYFSRVEDQSSKILDEMDFNVQKIFAAFTDETAQIIGRLADQSSNSLEFFDKGIKDLAENMDEHTRSIGLYAKEINMDVADLSGNLRSSVQEFSTQMEVGITHTFDGFDQGLGEVTLRLATILENIRESAEALQKALRR